MSEPPEVPQEALVCITLSKEDQDEILARELSHSRCYVSLTANPWTFLADKIREARA